MPPTLTALDHLVLTVADINRSNRFYATVLGMQPESFRGADDTLRHALRFGRQKINLHEAGREFEPKADRPLPGSADLCFLTETAATDWQDHLQAHGIALCDGPVRRTGATGPILSLYIRDPDGNLIEIGTPLPQPS